MGKKVFLGIGHGGIDSGASANGFKEKNMTLTIGLACRDYLQANGVKVGMSRTKDENDDINERIRECNAFNPDIAMDIHINSGKGDGFESYYHYKGGLGKTLAKNCESEVKKLGQNSRGCKIKKNSSGTDYYAFIRETKCPAVINELGFIDNKTDLKAFDTEAELKAFGYAYGRGCLKTLGLKDNGLKGETTSKTSYYIKVTNVKKGDVLNIREKPNASSRITGKLVYNDPNIYTIVEEKTSSDGGKWGKLKSGIGWINLHYTKKV